MAIRINHGFWIKWERSSVELILILFSFLSLSSFQNAAGGGGGAGVAGVEDWVLGPFIKQDDVNPFMGPLNTTRFYCPIRQEVVLWEEKDVFNPTALIRNETVHLLYRAEDIVGAYNGTSRIGLATSSDGLHFEREPLPILYPTNYSYIDLEWEGGCEDPRIVEDENGIYFMTYTAYDGSTARLFIASTRDLREWTKHGPVFKNADGGSYIDLWSKAGSIVTRREGDRFIATKINGSYWMYWGESNVFLAWSLDLVNWIPLTDEQIGGEGKNLTVTFGPREGKFDSDIVEPGPQAVLTEHGIVLIYNGRNKDPLDGGDPTMPRATYSAGQVLLDPNSPWILLNRTESYFMTPDKEYELIGQVGNVVFVEGLVHFQNKWFLYYGTADSKIAVAVAE